MSRAAAYVVPDLPRTATVSSVRFFFIAQVALLIVVLVGFSPTFYLRPLFKVHPLPAVLYLHGAVLTVGLCSQRCRDGWFRRGAFGCIAASGTWWRVTRRSWSSWDWSRTRGWPGNSTRRRIRTTSSSGVTFS